MSLPQRKKSAEEIAKLRESLGIGGPPPVEGSLPVEMVQEEVVSEISEAVSEPQNEEIVIPVEAEDVSPPTPLAPLPVAEDEEVKVVRSLKRSERIPVLPVEESGPPHDRAHAPEPMPIQTSAPLPAPAAPKMVRSLRKSEQGPLPVVQPPRPDSKLPIHRRSDEELNELRRREALAKPMPPLHPQVLAAHPVVFIPGYLFALGAGVGFHFYDLEKAITAACVVVALLISAFIFFKKPLSRHHAAFIAVMSLFVIIFGALYYFPQLQHGT